MAQVISEQELATAVVEGEQVVTVDVLRDAAKGDKLILSGDRTCVEGLKYDFRLGPWILVGGKQPLDVRELSETERRSLVIRPGELVYVMTEEAIALPGDIKAELSLKRKISHAGVLVLGGFCVDPGYVGRLLFALFNFSSVPFPLEPGRKLIAAQFYRLDPSETPPSRNPTPILEFPADLVRLMAVYEPSTASALKDQLSTVQKQLEALRTTIQERHDWFDRFERNLDRTRDTIDRVATDVERVHEGLKRERDSRLESEKEFKQRLTEVTRETLKHGILIAMAAAILAVVVGAVLLKALAL